MDHETIRSADLFQLPHWPDETQFPLSDAQCAALCRGHAVRWPLDLEALSELPGRYELLEGWLVMKR